MGLEPAKRYEILVGLYEHYNELLLKGAGLVYAIISGLGAFYVAHAQETYGSIVVIIACLVAVLSSFILLMSRSLLSNLESELKKVSKDLELTAYPTVKPLSLFLLVHSIVMLGLVVGGCIYLVW